MVAIYTIVGSSIAISILAVVSYNGKMLNEWSVNGECEKDYNKWEKNQSNKISIFSHSADILLLLSCMQETKFDINELR